MDSLQPLPMRRNHWLGLLKTAMDIRLYREIDRPQLVAFWKKAFPDDPPHNEPEKVIDAKLKVDDLIFVATEAGQLIAAAMAGYDGHRGWLYSVAVDQSKRRNGIGSKLVRHVVRALHVRGCVKINLQVRSANAAVVSFYGSLGFMVEDRISMGFLRILDAQPPVAADAPQAARR